MSLRRRLASALAGAGLGALTLGVAAALAQAPGDPTRGRAVFEDKQCIRCHPARGQRGVGPPLEELRRPQGALELAGRLWNHAPAMAALLQQEGLEWPRLVAAEMTDLMAFLRADAARDPEPDPRRGQVLLLRKGCLKCHRLRREGGSVGIELTRYRGGYDSPVVWTTGMWNHSPRMAGHAQRLGFLYPRFSGDEMVNLFAFLKNAAAVSPQ